MAILTRASRVIDLSVIENRDFTMKLLQINHLINYYPQKISSLVRVLRIVQFWRFFRHPGGGYVSVSESIRLIITPT
jgi:hypothetical protein